MEARFCEGCGALISAEDVDLIATKGKYLCNDCQKKSSMSFMPTQAMSVNALKKKESTGRRRMEKTAARMTFRCKSCDTKLSIKRVNTKSKLTCPKCKEKLIIYPGGRVELKKDKTKQQKEGAGALGEMTLDFEDVSRPAPPPADDKPLESTGLKDESPASEDEEKPMGGVFDGTLDIPAPPAPEEQKPEPPEEKDEGGFFDGTLDIEAPKPPEKETAPEPEPEPEPRPSETEEELAFDDSFGAKEDKKPEQKPEPGIFDVDDYSTSTFDMEKSAAPQETEPSGETPPPPPAEEPGPAPEPQTGGAADFLLPVTDTTNEDKPEDDMVFEDPPEWAQEQPEQLEPAPKPAPRPKSARRKKKTGMVQKQKKEKTSARKKTAARSVVPKQAFDPRAASSSAVSIDTLLGSPEFQDACYFRKKRASARAISTVLLALALAAALALAFVAGRPDAPPFFKKAGEITRKGVLKVNEKTLKFKAPAQTQPQADKPGENDTPAGDDNDPAKEDSTEE